VNPSSGGDEQSGTQSELYRKLVEHSTDVATIIDAEGKIAYVSPSVERVLGYEPSELVGEVGYEYQPPEDRPVVAEAIEQLHERPDEPQTVEVRFRQADGSWCWVESRMRNHLDDDVIDGILVVSRDVTDRKRREGELRELAGEYRALLDNSEDAIFLLDVESDGDGEPQFRFERLSPSYEEQTGLTTEEVRGKTPAAVFGDERGRELTANYHRCVRAREPISYQEELHVTADARIWETNLAPVITDGDVSRIVGITRNVTERVERERQLRSRNEQLDEFASVVSHDLRNPLNVAVGRLDLLESECDSDHLPPIVRALSRMEEIVDDTLTLARQGQTVAETEPVDLGALVDACWQTVGETRASVELVADATLRGDRSRLRHVFENLFRNAVEHGGEDVTVRVGRLGDRGFFVEDDGPGIPPDDRAAVFDPGHTTGDGGTGFGLTIVNRITEAHGWSVSVAESAVGGARFEFEHVDFVDRE
jgi:PAS domain S-box-containing protein